MINFNNVLKNEIFAKRKLKIVIELLDGFSKTNNQSYLSDAETVCNIIIKTYPCFLAVKALSVVLLKSYKLDKLRDCLELMESVMDKDNIKQLHNYNKFKSIVNIYAVQLSKIIDEVE